MAASEVLPNVVVDARWRGYTGIGRVTSLFLDGLRELGIGDDWLVWIREDDELPAGLPIRATGHAPTALLAQRDLRRVPDGLQHLWMHAVRPLTTQSHAVVVHDVIPLTQYPWPQRELWRRFFRRSVASAERVLVYSGATQERVEALLGVPSSRIGRFELTIDTSLADRVRSLRADRSRLGDGHLLYVGQFKPHKNLPLAVRAFGRTEAARAGRTFVLVGGLEEECEHLRRRVASEGLASGAVRVLPRCSDDELVALYADADAVIQPSIEEGFGLTVLEARVAGIPVACSRIPTHVDASGGDAELFDPDDVEGMAEAIDAALRRVTAVRPEVPSVGEFAAGLLRAAEIDAPRR